MKKNLLTLGLISLGVCANAQVLTYVGPGAEMTITSNALVYSGGGWQNATDGKVNNSGNVMVVSSENTALFDVAQDSFVLKFNPASGNNSENYGQLYINGLIQDNVKGKVVKEHSANPSSPTGKQQVALPFFGLTIGDLKAATGVAFQTTNASITTAGQGRFHPGAIYRWNNVTARFDHVVGNDDTVLGKATDYFAIPRRSSSEITWDPTTIKSFKGRALADAGETQDFTLLITTVASFGGNGAKNNGYNEYYNSYLNDPFVTDTSNAKWTNGSGYGKNLSQFANPFLTNLDLSTINSSANLNGAVEGIAYYNPGSFSWSESTGTTYNANPATIIKFSGNLSAGDLDKLVIKPMQEVMIKFNPNVTALQTLNLDNLRTFSSKASASPTINARKARSTSNDVARQIGVVLVAEDGTEVDRTYYVVASGVESGYNGMDASLQAVSKSNIIFTREELREGGIDLNHSNNLYINEANELNFKGKEIPLFVNFGEKSFLKFEIHEGGERLGKGNSLSNGVDFYIKTDTGIVRIKDGDIINHTTKQYGLFYDQPLGTLDSSEIAKSGTIIAKKGLDWVVRFANTWSNAKIEIYSATGQLIHMKENVNTINDYVLPINTNVQGVYIVKATSNKGDVVVKKITK